jgi:hypothetical protein
LPYSKIKQTAKITLNPLDLRVMVHEIEGLLQKRIQRRPEKPDKNNRVGSEKTN